MLALRSDGGSVGRAPRLPTVRSDGVAGYLFQDRDGDGTQDPDEPVLGGRTVEVFGTGPLPLGSATTDASGRFVFRKLTVAGRSVQVRTPPVMEGPAVADLPDKTRLLFAATISLGRSDAVAVPSYRWCPSVDDCPGLEPPDLAPTFESVAADEYPPSTEWALDRTSEPGRILLRVATSVANRGGLLHVVGRPPADGAEERQVVQRVYGDGVEHTLEVGSFVHHPEHEHVHMADFVELRLRSTATGKVVARSDKLSFCLTDVQPIAPPDPEPPVTLDLPPFECGADEQGINRGWADYYGRELPGQSIDVTGLPSGGYVVEIEADPQELMLDADRSNNQASFPVVLDLG